MSVASKNKCLDVLYKTTIFFIIFETKDSFENIYGKHRLKALEILFHIVTNNGNYNQFQRLSSILPKVTVDLKEIA